MRQLLEKLFLEESSNTIITRLITTLESYELTKILKPVVVSAEIENEEAVLNYINTIFPFNIKDINIDIKSQTLSFKIFGVCYVEKEDYSYRLLRDNFSLQQTNKYNTLKIIKEEFAEENSLRLKEVPGIKLNYI